MLKYSSKFFILNGSSSYLQWKEKKIERKHTCRSVKSRLAAISIRLGRHKYLLKWNSFSNSSNCVFVYAVRNRRGKPFSATNSARKELRGGKKLILIYLAFEKFSNSKRFGIKSVILRNMLCGVLRVWRRRWWWWRWRIYVNKFIKY